MLNLHIFCVYFHFTFENIIHKSKIDYVYSKFHNKLNITSLHRSSNIVWISKLENKIFRRVILKNEIPKNTQILDTKFYLFVCDSIK